MVLVLATILLSACSGVMPTPTPLSGMPAAPTLSLGYGIKQLKFTWSAVSGATHYQLLENPDGVSDYTQVGDNLTATAYDHGIFLPKRVNARYLLNACNSAGCTGSSEIFMSASLMAAAIGHIKTSNTGAFGHSLALSSDGNTLGVGATGENSSATGINGNQTDNGARGSGAVYVYTRSGSVWAQQAYVKASNTGAGDQFGYSLALSDDGNTLAVGAINEGSNATGINGNQANNRAERSGAAYVYTRSDGVWAQQAYVKASNTEAGDNFGNSLALSGDGNNLAVGADNEDSNATGINGGQADNRAVDSGAVYVYTRSGGVWTQQAYVKASNTQAKDSFGQLSLALSDDGNTLAVGATGEDSSAIGINGSQTGNSAEASGAIYVYIRSGGVWAQQAYVKASNAQEQDIFGHSLALSGDGNTLAVGAVGESSGASGINGSQANNRAFSSGAVYVYTRSGGVWAWQTYVKASNTQAIDLFGWSLALSGDGNTLAVGAFFEGSNATGINGNQADNSAERSGAVYVYTRNGSIWRQQAYIKASHTRVGDAFGQSLSLDSNGNTLAVGAVLEGSNATGIGGNQSDNSVLSSGAVYLY